MSDPIDKMIDFFCSLASFEKQYLDYLRSHTRIRSVSRTGYYLRAGEISDKFAYVATGLFRYYFCDCEGKDYTAWFADENSFIPSFASVSTGTESRFTIEALEDSQVAEFPIKILNELENLSESARLLSRNFLLQALLEKEKRESSLVLDNAIIRYQDFQDRFSHLEKRLKLHHIASYLGISPVSLSRIRRKNQKETQVNA
ncbi:MAG: Crp/Fnr family transcriptional regulator [Spirochaetes bacterium]|nr:Crp/Fnr family transcriptional regulator [Spirochaetota bacterium]